MFLTKSQENVSLSMSREIELIEVMGLETWWHCDMILFYRSICCAGLASGLRAAHRLLPVRGISTTQKFAAPKEAAAASGHAPGSPKNSPHSCSLGYIYTENASTCKLSTNETSRGAFSALRHSSESYCKAALCASKKMHFLLAPS